jgi:hypothetical protein
MSSDLAVRETLAALVAAYNQAQAEIREGYALLECAQQRLQAAFLAKDYTFQVNYEHRSLSKVGEQAAQEDLKRLKRAAWGALVERMELKRVLSMKRSQELDKQILDAKPELPELSEENVLSLFQDSLAHARESVTEKVREVYEFLHPRGGAASRLKTNEKWRLGKKAILYAVELYNGGFRVRYRYDDKVTALDAVFHLLDGRGIVPTHHGPLFDAIEASGAEGEGHTEYFRFRCCLNGNLHLEFRRPDLVDRLNAVAADGKSIGGA